MENLNLSSILLITAILITSVGLVITLIKKIFKKHNKAEEFVKAEMELEWITETTKIGQEYVAIAKEDKKCGTEPEHIVSFIIYMYSVQGYLVCPNKIYKKNGFYYIRAGYLKANPKENKF